MSKGNGDWSAYLTLQLFSFLLGKAFRPPIFCLSSASTISPPSPSRFSGGSDGTLGRANIKSVSDSDKGFRSEKRI